MVKGFLKWYQRLLAVATFIYVVPLANATASEHRVAKFHYTQAQYRQALSWLAGLPRSELQAKTLVKLGLFEEARVIFNALPQQNAESARADFWLNQAARHFYNAQVDQAKSDLSRLTIPLFPRLKSQYYYLKARLALLDDDLSSFYVYRETLQQGSVLRHYLEHHFIVLQIENKRLQMAHVDEYLVQSSATSSSMRALFERTWLAIGLDFVEQGDSVAAIAAFEKITLTSPFIESALLGYGWALNENEQFSKAHQVFSLLAQKDPQFYVQQRALRGFAFSKERTGDWLGANELLEQGLVAYSQEKIALAQLSQRFAVDGPCLNLAIVAQWSAQCHTPTSELLTMLANHNMVSTREQLLELASLEQDYREQLAALSMHQERLVERKQRVNKRLNVLPLAQVLSLIEQLNVQRDTLNSAMEHAIGRRNTHFFMPEKYIKQQEALDGLYREMVLLKRAGLGNRDSQRRADFIQRTIWWHSKSNYTKNKNSAEQSLASLNQQIVELGNMHQDFVNYAALVNDIDGDLGAIANLKRQLQQQQQIASQLAKDVTQRLSLQFINHLASRQHALKQAVINTKLSRLKLQDNSYQKQLTLGAVEGEK